MTGQPALGEQPSRMQPTDLGSAFTSPARSGGLGGRLTPLHAAPPVSDPERPTVSGTVPRTRTPRAETPSQPPPPTSAARPSSGLKPIVVYVSASVRERLRSAAGERSYTEVVLAALDTTYPVLRERFTDSPSPTNSLFAGRGRPRRQRHNEPQVQVSLRPLREDLAVIDRLVVDTDAPSRSALVNGALDEFLPGAS